MNRSLRAIISLLILLTAASAAELGSADEYEIKAAMLLNLTRFIEWPAAKLGDSAAPFVIGIIGNDPFGRDLDKLLNGKAVNGHPVQIVRMTANQHVESCHILFVSRGERKRFEEMAATLARASVLTVGDGDRFTSGGSVVGFVIRDNRVQIEVNLGAAQRHGLVVSSRLLRLATVVKDGA